MGRLDDIQTALKLIKKIGKNVHNHLNNVTVIFNMKNGGTNGMLNITILYICPNSCPSRNINSRKTLLSLSRFWGYINKDLLAYKFTIIQ